MHGRLPSPSRIQALAMHGRLDPFSARDHGESGDLATSAGELCVGRVVVETGKPESTHRQHRAQNHRMRLTLASRS